MFKIHWDNCLFGCFKMFYTALRTSYLALCTEAFGNATLLASKEDCPKRSKKLFVYNESVWELPHPEERQGEFYNLLESVFFVFFPIFGQG